MAWIKAAPLGTLTDRPFVFNHPPRQIAVFSVDGRRYAIDNRCPHEGYPLAAGTVDEDCVLTCNWHNWKFRLSDGECLIGGDHVRSYRTKAEDGHIWIDVSDPPKDEIRKEVFRGLRKAFDERDFGRICRELARLHFHGIDPKEAVVKAIEWSHDRLEFGTTHAMAATADWLALAGTAGRDLEPELICLTESIDHYAFDSLRHPACPYPGPASAPFSADAFHTAVETENREQAESLIARALADGLHWPDVEEAMAGAALAHYNDFGHSLIYVAKAGQLLEALGTRAERWVALPLARSLCYAFREDLIPEFREYGPVLDRLPPVGTSRPSASRPGVPYPMNTPQALGWLAEHAGTHDAQGLYDALLEALALNMLHFDTRYGEAYDRPVSQNVSWLDFTHGLTFANAARVLCNRYPRLWPAALAQMACFLGRSRPFILKDAPSIREDWKVDDSAGFFAGIRERLLDHGLRDPIFSAHLLKTSMAVEAELAFASESCREALLASLHRFLASPLKTKHVRRLARQAIALVARDFAPPPPVSPGPRA